jgi:hypothetical protein
MGFRTVGVAFVLLAAPLTAHAPTEAPTPPQFSAAIDLMRLELTVLDKRMRACRNGGRVAVHADGRAELRDS